MLLRVLERIHGHLGWLVIALLLHPAIVLRDPRRRARLAASLTLGFVAVTAALGAFLYPEYRSRLRTKLFLDAPTIGWLFERKEHLAVGAVAFALVGALVHLGLPLFANEAERTAAAKLAHLAFVAAFVLSLVVGVLGVVVASRSSF